MEQKFNKEQSVELIKEMILQAKGNIAHGAGKYLILWGCIMFIGAIAQFILINMLIADAAYDKINLYSFLVWGVATVIAIIGHIILIRQDKITPVTTHIDFIVSRVWIGYAVFAALSGIIMGFIGEPKVIIASILLLYTFALYLTAVICKFKQLYPLIIACLGCIFVLPFVDQLYYPLVMAFALICGSIIPGYLFKQYSKNNV